jgi:putative intracellular protease/amidase
MKQKVVVFLFNGFSDWEIAYLSPELKKSDAFDLIYLSAGGRPVTSMGGLSVVPDASLADIQAGDVAMLILPGGNAWDQGGNTEIDALVQAMAAEEKPIAAICAATAYLARKGYLDDVKHTSNALVYLKAVAPQYAGEALYVDEPAVSDRNIITANGTVPVDFAREIFACLGLYDQQTLERWYQLFKYSIWTE